MRKQTRLFAFDLLVARGLSLLIGGSTMTVCFEGFFSHLFAYCAL